MKLPLACCLKPQLWLSTCARAAAQSVAVSSTPATLYWPSALIRVAAGAMPRWVACELRMTPATPIEWLSSAMVASRVCATGRNGFWL